MSEDPGFVADCRQALRAWKAFPQLPIISAALGLGVFLPSYLGLIVVVMSIFELGWHGTSRILYLRAFRGKPAKGSELWAMTKAYIGRFFVAGLLIGVPFAILFVIVISQRVAHIRSGASAAFPSWFLVATVTCGFVVDLILTFVAPALAYSTNKAREAYRIGFRMIKESWPACAVYVIIPPLAVQIASTSGVTGRRLPLVAGAVTFVVRMFGLMLKGAIAAFYLRRFVVPDDGAAFAPYVSAIGPPPLPPPSSPLRPPSPWPSQPPPLPPPSPPPLPPPR